MTTILENAEKRLSESIADTHQTEQDGVEAMRNEVGRTHFDQAKIELPKLERVIHEEIFPFLTRITALSKKAPIPLPQYVAAWLQEMENNSQKVPPFVKSGIDAWGQLRVPMAADGRSVDVNARATLIYQTRMRLMNWNGHESRFRDLKAQVENYLKESGWPARQPTQET
jgi:hypothetical protein